MKKEYECNLCGEKPCVFIVDIEKNFHKLPENCPYHNPFNIKAKWMEKKK